MRNTPRSCLWAAVMTLTACKSTLDPGPVEPGPPVACEKEGLLGPNRVSAADHAARYGASGGRYSALPTTKERPLESCGIAPSIEALTRLTCDDGSRPFGDDTWAAAEARVGSVGSGGRCGAIIDLYHVDCPEGRYAVFVDVYFCASPTSAAEQVEAAREDDVPTTEAALAQGSDRDADPERREHPDELPPVTEAEFRAWSRTDPAAEKRIFEWDRDNLDRMLSYFGDLQCFRHPLVAAGDAYAAGKSSEAEWTQVRRAHIIALNEWVQQLRALEKSKLMGNLLEAHELVMTGYPQAYERGDQAELAKQDAHWQIIEAKVRKYVEVLGVEQKLESLSALDCASRRKQ